MKLVSSQPKSKKAKDARIDTAEWRMRKVDEDPSDTASRGAAALLEKLSSIQLAELSFRTVDGTRLRFERASLPSAEQAALLASLGWQIPDKYLPADLRTEQERL